tara:strand:+ start:111 stop:356 length:246 start_codon:yes stop_codon:yes gene_type:complete
MLFSFAICDAGVSSRKSIKKSDLNLYRSIIETNTISNINIAKLIIKYNLKGNYKLNIIFISSIVGEEVLMNYQIIHYQNQH